MTPDQGQHVRIEAPPSCNADVEISDWDDDDEDYEGISCSNAGDDWKKMSSMASNFSGYRSSFWQREDVQKNLAKNQKARYLINPALKQSRGVSAKERPNDLRSRNMGSSNGSAIKSSLTNLNAGNQQTST